MAIVLTRYPRPTCGPDTFGDGSYLEVVAALPVQFASKFEMVVDLKTAKALGLAVPQSILLRADEMIE
jgi:putative tryptophan/tyrosine transport system substrate-binding protein